MNRSRKDNTMLIVMGVLVLFAAYTFLIRPQGAELSSLRDDRQRVQQQISSAELALLTPVDESGDPSVTDPTGLAVSVPADPAVPTLLRQLQSIAVETGMLHGSISPSPLSVNPSGPGGSLQIAITASGTHDATLAYVQRLRDFDRLFVIEQIGITVQPDATEQLVLAARVFTSGTPVAPTP